MSPLQPPEEDDILTSTRKSIRDDLGYNVTPLLHKSLDNSKIAYIDMYHVPMGLFRYIKDKDDELGSRLNLQPKQVRSALADLQQEGLVAQEEMPDETFGSRLSAYWYVDLKQAVDVIRLRVNEMQLILHEKQTAKMASQVTNTSLKCYLAARSHAGDRGSAIMV